MTSPGRRLMSGPVVASGLSILLVANPAHADRGSSAGFSGVSWTTAGSFDHSLDVAAVGPFAGNHPTGGVQADFTALVDCVFDASSPIVPEDNGEVEDDVNLRQGFLPTGAFGFYRWRAPASDRFELRVDDYSLGPVEAVALEFGTAYVFEMPVVTNPDDTSTYSFKHWPQAGPEPAGWQLTATDTGADDPLNGSAILVAHEVDATFGNITVNPVTP